MAHEYEVSSLLGHPPYKCIQLYQHSDPSVYKNVYQNSNLPKSKMEHSNQFKTLVILFNIKQLKAQNTSMVLIHFKKSDKNQFLLEFSSEARVSDMIHTIIQYNNLRIYLDRLVWSVEELANKGVLKPPELQAVSYEDYQKSPSDYSSLSPDKLSYATKPVVIPPYRFVTDKSNQRHGVILPLEEQQKLLNVVKLGKALLESKGNKIIEKQQYLNVIENIRLAVMLTYPAYLGLPEWQPTLLILQEKLSLQILQSENFQYYDQRCLAWWAGKELDKKKKISEYAGKNQKTKIIVKLQKIGGQQPLREPPVDSKTYEQMVKYYYRKVDESKEFDNRSIETHYEKMEGKSLKQKVHLGDQVRYKPF